MRESKHQSRQFIASGAALLGCIVLGSGCASLDQKSPPPNLPTREAQVKLVEGLTPEQPKRRFLRTLNPPKQAEPLRFLPPPYDLTDTPEGRAGAAEMKKIQQTIAGSDWPKQPASGKERVIFDSEEGEYELEFDMRGLAALAAKATARGINDATEGGVEGQPRPPETSRREWLPIYVSHTQNLTNETNQLHYPTLIGWSDNQDNRIQKPTSFFFPMNHRALMRIGELNGGGCSGALIGRRLVLTAAHCIVRADLSYNIHSYRARRSGTQEPFGEATSNGYWYATKWVSNNCHMNRVWDPCSQHDWAIIRLRDDAWTGSPNGTPGWMGYAVYSRTYIAQNPVSHNDGYPVCGWPASPANCMAGQPYGQLAGCTARGFKWPHNGVPSYYRIACDISGGHSGSPNWTDCPNGCRKNGPYVIGIAMWEHCFANDLPCTDLEGDYPTHPNGFRGMTPWLANFITNLRVTYP